MLTFGLQWGRLGLLLLASSAVCHLHRRFVARLVLSLTLTALGAAWLARLASSSGKTAANGARLLAISDLIPRLVDVLLLAVGAWLPGRCGASDTVTGSIGGAILPPSLGLISLLLLVVWLKVILEAILMPLADELAEVFAHVLSAEAALFDEPFAELADSL